MVMLKFDFLKIWQFLAINGFSNKEKDFIKKLSLQLFFNKIIFRSKITAWSKLLGFLTYFKY